MKAAAQTVLCLMSLVVFVVSSCPCDTSASRQALTALYESTTGATWRNSTNWNTASPVCIWFGIHCGSDEALSIRLRGNKLTGTLPGALHMLQNLTVFDVDENSLTGALPDEYSAWTAIQYFSVSYNSFSGALPVEYGSSWTSIVEFIAAGNKLSGTLPPLPAWNATLTTFSIASNQLTGALPLRYSGDLRSIQQFDVSSNGFSGTLPASYSVWTALIVFMVSSNSLNGTLPAEYGAWRLARFSVDGNQFLGTLPQEYGNWGSGTWKFEAACNRLSGTLPPSYSRMRPRTFNVSYNALSGTLPREYAVWGNATVFFVVYLNNFTGTLPPEYKDWSSMTLFFVGHNHLSGTLPREYRNWSNVATFSAPANQLSGPLPPDYADFGASILQFVVASNRLSGTIPPSYFANWSRLVSFVVSSNRLNGSLPSQLTISSLGNLVLDNNNFRGSLPQTLGSSLMLLSLHNNPNLSGPFPRTWTKPVWFATMCNTSITFLCGVLAMQATMFLCRSVDIAQFEGERIDPQQVMMEMLPYLEKVSCNSSRAAANSTTASSVGSPSSQTLMFANNIGIAATAALMPASVLVLRRTASAQILQGCAGSSERLQDAVEVTNAPLQPDLGDGEGVAHRGAVIGNVCLWVACAASAAVAVLVRVLVGNDAKVHESSAAVQREKKLSTCSAVRAAGSLRLPGVLMLPINFLLPQVVVSSVVLLAAGHSDPLNAGVGVTGVATTCGIVCGLCWILNPKSEVFAARAEAVRQTLRTSSSEKSKPWSCATFLRRLVSATVVWKPRNSGHWCKRHFVLCWGFLYNSMLPQRHWWLLVDVAASLAVSAVTGLPSASTAMCAAQAWACVVISTVYLTLLVALWPKQRRLAMWIDLFSNSAQTLVYLCTALHQYEAANTLTVVSTAVVITLSILFRIGRYVVDRKATPSPSTSPDQTADRRHVPEGQRADDARRSRRHSLSSQSMCSSLHLDYTSDVLGTSAKDSLRLVVELVCDSRRRQQEGYTTSL